MIKQKGVPNNCCSTYVGNLETTLVTQNLCRCSDFSDQINYAQDFHTLKIQNLLNEEDQNSINRVKITNKKIILFGFTFYMYVDNFRINNSEKF